MSIRGVRPIVCGADGQPIARATVVLYGMGFTGAVGTTDAHGGYTFQVPHGETDVCLKVQGIAGYQKYLWSDLIPDKDVNLCIGTTAGGGDLQLPSLRPNTPAHNRREVRAGFCNLQDSRIVAPSTLGRPIFSPYFPCLPADQQQEWIGIWQAAHMTHVAIMLDDPIYPEGLPQYGGAEYPAPHFAPSVDQFHAACALLLSSGFTPIVFTTTGEIPADWDAYRDKVRAYCGPFTDQIIAVEGWEPFGTSEQFRAWFQAMRDALGPSAVLACHLPFNYIDNGQGDADWADSGCFGDVDVFLMQLCPYQNAAEFASIQGGWAQCITRVIETPGVDYRFRGRSKPVDVCLFEHAAYFQIRREITDADLMLGVDYAQSLGVQWFGNSDRF